MLEQCVAARKSYKAILNWLDENEMYEKNAVVIENLTDITPVFNQIGRSDRLSHPLFPISVNHIKRLITFQNHKVAIPLARAIEESQQLPPNSVLRPLGIELGSREVGMFLLSLPYVFSTRSVVEVGSDEVNCALTSYRSGQQFKVSGVDFLDAMADTLRFNIDKALIDTDRVKWSIGKLLLKHFLQQKEKENAINDLIPYLENWSKADLMTCLDLAERYRPDNQRDSQLVPVKHPAPRTVAQPI